MVFATYRQILAAPMPQGGPFLSNRMSQARCLAVTVDGVCWACFGAVSESTWLLGEAEAHRRSAGLSAAWLLALAHWQVLEMALRGGGEQGEAALGLCPTPIKGCH